MQHAFMASLDLARLIDGLDWTAVIASCLLPIFLLIAWGGTFPWAGLLQALFLILVEAIIWQLSRGLFWLTRGLYLVLGYLWCNWAFTFGYVLLCEKESSSQHELICFAEMLIFLSVVSTVSVGIAHFANKKTSKAEDVEKSRGHQ